MSSANSQVLRLSKADKTPMLDFNGETGVFVMSGVSNPENASEFYQPVLNWLEDFIQSKPKKLTVEIRLDYFSTSSSKMILQLLKKFEALKKNGAEVVIKWIYFEEDEDLKEAGQQYSEIVAVPFEFISYKD